VLEHNIEIASMAQPSHSSIQATHTNYGLNR
jgi:hypothetical protein